MDTYSQQAYEAALALRELAVDYGPTTYPVLACSWIDGYSCVAFLPANDEAVITYRFAPSPSTEPYTDLTA